MFSSKMITTASALLLVGSAYGHAVMNTPTPYGFHDLQSSPLNGQTFQFPCQSGSRTDAYDPSGANNPPVAAGSTQLVNFTSAAVHGGGSCQFSITYDYPPPADQSKWKVIHTIIGDCPAIAAGNIPVVGTDGDGRPDGRHCGNGVTDECVQTFDIPIPKELKSGNVTFAWTWFNKIGNREIYMNCAPLEITNGASDDTFFNSLPSMFIANIPGECTTVEGVLNIPNPGNSVQKLVAPDAAAIGTCGTGSSSPPTNSGSSSSAAAPAASSSAAAVFAPGASSAAAAPAPAATSSPAANSSPAETPAPAPDAPSTSTPTADGVACTNEGGVVCMGTGYFGLCDHGYAVKMMVSAGTQCVDGAVVRRGEPRQNLHARRINLSS